MTLQAGQLCQVKEASRFLVKIAFGLFGGQNPFGICWYYVPNHLGKNNFCKDKHLWVETFFTHDLSCGMAPVFQAGAPIADRTRSPILLAFQSLDGCDAQRGSAK